MKRKQMVKKKKILVLGNSYLVVFGFRGELIEKLVSDGYDVTVCFPNGPFGKGEETAKQYGCNFIENSIDRRGTNPLKDLFVIKEYYSIIKQQKPDVVLAYTVKPDVYGGMICRLLKIPFIPNITGLGKGLDEGGVIQKITIILYKVSTKRAAYVFFQNTSDKTFFDTHGIKYEKATVLPGSGVNLNEFKPLPYPEENEPIRFIYVARVMKAKGIEQFFDAAHELKKQYQNIEFHICGFCEEDYRDSLNERVKKGEVIYHGLVNDVMTFEQKCHCVVLPSFHPEGISNVLLEGAACARPLITTDHAGCKETVKDGVTGYIIKQRDSNSLIEKMKEFINLPYDQKVQMGVLGRKKMEKEFSRQIVIDAYMNVINEEI